MFPNLAYYAWKRSGCNNGGNELNLFSLPNRLFFILASVKNDYLFNNIKKPFFTQTLFSKWNIEMDHHECTTGGGVGSTSDETFSLIHEKINECEKGVFFIYL
jgi:hypothetical protein